jgi:aryl-alcohol dehydrogenase
MLVTAAVAPSKGAPLEIRELELAPLRPDEVRVKMVASGVCHTDAIVRDQLYPTPLPAVLGHEGAGIVTEVGSMVASVAVGDKVVLSPNSCGHCRHCLTGHPSYCVEMYDRNFGGRRPDGTTAFSEKGKAVSSTFFGQSSFSSYADVAMRSVVKVEPDAPLELLGPLGCGLQTGAGGVLNVLQPVPGSSFVVFGSGAVGLAGLLAAKVAGCTTLIAVDLVPSRLALAKELGATHVIDSSKEDPVAAIRELTDGGADSILETTAVPAVLRQAAESLAIRGTVALVGAAAPGKEVTFEIGESLTRGWNFRTVIEGDAVSQVFIPQLIALWKQGRFPFDKLVGFYALEDINQAFADSASGKTIKPIIRFAQA